MRVVSARAIPRLWSAAPGPGDDVSRTVVEIDSRGTLARWLCGRALVYHAMVVVIVPACVLAGWWQVHRAMGGNTLSYAYSVEWPAFAVLAVVGWWQLIHEHPAEVEARKQERQRRARQAGRPTIPDLAVSDVLLLAQRAGEVQRSRAALAARPTRNTEPALGERGDGAGLALGERPDGAGLGLGERPDGAGLGLGERGDGAEVGGAEPSGMAAYNAYLAVLAERGHAKTWRNPRGL